MSNERDRDGVRDGGIASPGGGGIAKGHYVDTQNAVGTGDVSGERGEEGDNSATKSNS